MSFLGIPMGTDIASFKQELLAKDGFKDHPLHYDNIYGADGIFAGMVAAISIATTPKSKLVCDVAVAFTDFSYETYDSNAEQMQQAQENAYEYCKAKLINKYGNPTQNTITFGCNLKWCYWELNEGRIDLMITQPADTKTHRKLQLVYEDKITGQKNMIEEDEDW